MRDIEEKTMLKYAQTLSPQDRDSSKLMHAPLARVRLHTLESST